VSILLAFNVVDTAIYFVVGPIGYVFGSLSHVVRLPLGLHFFSSSYHLFLLLHFVTVT